MSQPDLRVRGESLIAVCYLRQEGNYLYSCRLTENYLHFQAGSKTETFELQFITAINLNRRKLLLPIVGGGIIATLGILAAFRYYNDIFLVLSIAFSGLLLIYYGYSGENVIVVEMKNFSHHFPVNRTGPNLAEFITFVNNRLHFDSGDDRRLIYIEIDSDTVNQDLINWLNLERPLNALNYRQYQLYGKKNKFYLALNPEKIPGEIRYQKDQLVGWHPVILGIIDIGSTVGLRRNR